jgi:hypothetical protein
MGAGADVKNFKEYRALFRPGFLITIRAAYWYYIKNWWLRIKR